MKKFYAQLLLQLAIGVILAYVTLDYLRLLHSADNSQLFGWLNITGVGAGLSASVVLFSAFLFGVDALWLLFFVLWLIKKKLHIKSDDNTLYLP